MTVGKLATLLVLALWPLVSSMAAEVKEAPEEIYEIVVIGRQSGPPLWKVSNGDKVLWIFPHLSWIPKDITWESERVARIIAESQEILSLPEWNWTAPRSVMLNPINVARTLRNSQRSTRILDGGTLEDILPAELFARFAVLQARYFPANNGPLEMRPLFAGKTMMNTVRKQEGLVSGDDILKTIQRLVRRNRDIKRTETSVRLVLGDGFREYTKRLNAVFESFPPEQEQACFEQQVRQVEEDLHEMKSLANDWAQGYINEVRYDEFSNVPLVFEESKACDDLFMGSSNPEHKALVGMITRVNQIWLDAAENALTTNESTFAILPISELLAEGGLLSELKAKGYEVKEP